MSFTKQLEKQLREDASKIEVTIQAARDLPETGHLYTTTEPGRLRVDVPFTPTAYTEYRKILGNKWQQQPETNQASQNDVGDNYWFFVHKETNVHLTLCLDATSEYATCKRIQTGTKEVKIFETVCK